MAKGPKPKPPEERFWRFVNKTDTCWLWTGSIGSHGYGQLTVGSKRDGSKRPVLVHRMSYEMHIGPIPDGLVIDHLCRVKACVNPLHMEPVLQAVNIERGAHSNRSKTHCANGHPFDEANTRMRKGGGRECKACNNAARLRRYHESKRSA